MFNPYIRRSPNWIDICRQYQIQYSIKDNVNILQYNVWSGTDYRKNADGFYYNQGINLTSTHDWAYNGDCSYKVENTNNYSELISLPRIKITENCNIKLSFHCHIDKNIQVILKQQNENGEQINQKSVIVPSNAETTIIISDQLIAEDNYILFQIYFNGNSTCYLDNFIMICQ